MSGTDKESSKVLKDALGGFLREHPLDEDLARRVQSAARSEAIPEDAGERAKRAVADGLFDGGVSRAKRSMGGTLGAFDTALRRIRIQAKRSAEEMALRAGVSAQVWNDVERKRVPLESVSVAELASMAEATQLGLADLRATIRRSLNVSLVASQAAYRADDPDDADTAAAFEDLRFAAAARTGEAADEPGDDRAETLVLRIAEELRRRGRAD